jgi:hypothetical protein
MRNDDVVFSFAGTMSLKVNELPLVMRNDISSLWCDVIK